MKRSIITVSAVALMAMAITSCGGTKPSTPEQAAAAGTGRVKVQRDECQIKGQGAINRAAGTARGVNESMTLDRALLDARTSLATQYGAMINGLLDNFDKAMEKQDQGQAAARNAEGTSNRIQKGYVDRFLTNTMTICENMYAETDGSYTVYVTVEAGEQNSGAIYDQLKGDGKLAIEYDRAQFMEDFDKAKAEYRNKN